MKFALCVAGAKDPMLQGEKHPLGLRHKSLAYDVKPIVNPLSWSIIITLGEKTTLRKKSQQGMHIYIF